MKKKCDRKKADSLHVFIKLFQSVQRTSFSHELVQEKAFLKERKKLGRNIFTKKQTTCLSLHCHPKPGSSQGDSHRIRLTEAPSPRALSKDR